ncbi:hypothetical protein [Saccharothrix syringae]|uniref:Secreted protein n=1 Tax=Saccharothrix syringae TaxID=103733 RepID=A0A5Q0H175_SACSY|nr:hypothetical protein [Saccharothrix syringae]QFZ19655.1 hypothetical protein EKG83_21445 [Saccharothrix syringae]
MRRKTNHQRRLVVFCFLLVLVPLTTQRAQGGPPCRTTGAELLAALFLPLAVPRSAWRLARLAELVPGHVAERSEPDRGGEPCPTGKP